MPRALRLIPTLVLLRQGEPGVNGSNQQQQPNQTERINIMTNRTNIGTPANLPMLSEMLGGLFLQIEPSNRKRKGRRRIIATMPNGAEVTIYKSGHTGWNLPNGYCFTSHLSSAKAAWIAAGATLKSVIGD